MNTREFSRCVRGLLLLTGLALAHFVHAQPMGLDEARLLLLRTSYAASASEIEQFSGLSREQAVDRLFSWIRSEAAIAPPPRIANYDRPQREDLMTSQAREAYRKEQVRRVLELRAW